MRRLVLVLFLAIPLLAQNTPATRPVFTIGKETTVVDGPLNADGTIDYIPAINALIGGRVKNEDNAAIPLLLLSAGTNKDQGIDDRTRETLEALRVTAPDKPAVVGQYFSDHLAAKNGTAGTLASVEESVRQAELGEKLRLSPWRAADQPAAAEWLKKSDEALKVIEEAGKRSGFFLPFCKHAKPIAVGGALDAMPTTFLLFMPKELLLSRAMMRAGERDLSGALGDIHCLRTLARLSEQEHLQLAHIFALAPEADAMRACAGLVTSGILMREELALVRGEILSLPELPDNDPVRGRMEEMLALDLMMQCIRGDSEKVMRLSAWDFNGNSTIDLGDWGGADWDAALRETRRLHSTDIAPGDSFAQRMDNLEKKKGDEGPSMLDSLNSIADTGNNNTVKTRVEAFLKQRADETRQAYTVRVTRWLAGANVSEVSRNLSISERARMLRVMALAAISLAEYRLAHGEYPDSLDKLGGPVPVDGFSGKEILYQRKGQGYQLWSVSFNRQDDGAGKDDLVVAVEK